MARSRRRRQPTERPNAVKIEIEHGGQRYTGTYTVSEGRIEVHNEHGSEDAALHDMPISGEEQQAYVEGLARSLLREVVEKHRRTEK
jgi:hypothetical protein